MIIIILLIMMEEEAEEGEEERKEVKCLIQSARRLGKGGANYRYFACGGGGDKS